MRFAIFGVGAVGGYFGARLAQLGEDVVFIARGDTLKALQSEGLRLDSVSGDLLLSSVNAVDDTSQAGVVDVVLVGVKTWQVPEVAGAIQPLLGEDTMEFIDTLPPVGTTSMQRDITEGRPSEIDAWNGAVVRFGDEAGVDVALHRFIYDSLRPLELNARGEISFL